MNIELILDEDGLFRRVTADHIKDNGGLTSAAFSNTTGTNDMSVDLARLTTPEEAVSKFPHCGVAKFLAGFARALDQKVLHDPLPENIAHTTVRGRKTKSTKRSLAIASIVVLLPLEKKA